MILDLSVFVCLSLLIYSMFVFHRDTNVFSQHKKVASIMNLAVSDIFDSKASQVEHGQHSRI